MTWYRAILALSVCIAFAYATNLRAALIVYEFSGQLHSNLGTSPAGTPFSGSFAYEFPQSGVTTSFFSGTQTVFGYDLLTMTIGDQTVMGSPGQLTLYNDVRPTNAVPIGDSLYSLLPTSTERPSASTGNLPGVTPNFIYLGFVDSSGVAFDAPVLPQSLTLSEFNEAFIGVNYGPFGAGNTTTIYWISSISVPEPSSIAMLSLGLFMLRRRRFGRPQCEFDGRRRKRVRVKIIGE